MKRPKRTTASSSRLVVIVAGEASGDMHGAMLVREMRRLDPDIAFAGIGGDRMQDAGVELIAHADDLAVVGVTEVLSGLGGILEARRKIKVLIKEKNPGLCLLIDFPDFNMHLAKFARKAGIPVFYYISPQVWAWRKNRIFALEKTVDRMAVILPFEEEVYRPTTLDVRFVGHPLLDQVAMTRSREEVRRELGLPPDSTVVALVPGSRRAEVQALLPIMLEAAALMAEQQPGIRFVLPRAEGISPETIDELRRSVPLEVTVVSGRFYDIVGLSDGAIVASGTSTLEAALLDVPMVIIYKVSPLSYLLGRIFVRVDHIGLVNIIAGREVVPELIQGDADPRAIAGELMPMIIDGERRKRVLRDLRQLKQLLGEPGAAARTAAMARELMLRALPVMEGDRPSQAAELASPRDGGVS